MDLNLNNYTHWDVQPHWDERKLHNRLFSGVVVGS